MDTRRKILTLDTALGIAPGLIVVTGYFDILRAGHVRELEEACGIGPGPVAGAPDLPPGTAADPACGAAPGPALAPAPRLLVVVLPGPRSWLDQRARAELVAGLRMVDYVVTADDAEVDRIIEALQPAKLVRLEAADERRARQLIDHVQRRQTR